MKDCLKISIYTHKFNAEKDIPTYTPPFTLEHQISLIQLQPLLHWFENPSKLSEKKGTQNIS